MVMSMAMKKITITLPEEQVDVLHALVRSGATQSVSGFVQQAVVMAIEARDSLDAVIAAALSETGGPITEEEFEWARCTLNGSHGEGAIEA
jgi:Arc/MetJ-type ribon-helix-helix transcriptional regulator